MLALCLFCFVNLIYIIPSALSSEEVSCNYPDRTYETVESNVLFQKVMHGNPAYNLTRSDPLYQKSLKINQPHINITFDNAHMYGVRDCEVIRLKFHADIWVLTFFCPLLYFKSDYVINGNIDEVQLDGKGKSEIVYVKYFISMYGGYETYVGADEREHIKFTYFNIRYNHLQDRADFKFSGLFDGDNEKSTEAHTSINSNWWKVQAITGLPIVHSMFSYMIYNFNKYFALVPKDYLSIRVE